MLQYESQVAHLFRDGGELRAGFTIEGRAETVPSEAKYHVPCYRELREQKPDEYPPLP